jgi:hypothetical protein
MHNEEIHLDKKKFQKMTFLINALEKGWTIQKKNNKYIFSKKHENKKEIFQADYLEKFIEKNLHL